jgi:tetratricopeptide (TPR) repeat protein
MRPLAKLRGQLVILLVGAGLCAHLLAATGTSEELYLDALRAISENRLQDAKPILSELIKIEPQHAGALLDLAIIQCALGNAQEADSLFSTIIEKFKPAAAILEVIASHRLQGCKPEQNDQVNSFISVALDRGFDSNVNQGASNPNFTLGSGTTQINLPLLPEYLPKKDQFTALSVNYMRELAPGSTIGFTQLRVRAFDTLSKFNTLAIGAGIEHPWRVGNWGTRSLLMLGGLQLDQQLYQKQQILQSRITPPFNLPETMQLSVIGGLTRTQYPTLSGYDATTWELRSLLAYQKKAYRAQASVAYLSDKASGNRIGGDRSGAQMSIQVKKRLYENLSAELGWTYQRWQSALDYSPGAIDRARDQRTQVLRATLNFAINARHSVQLEVRQAKNQENISLFDFNSRALQLSWLWQEF